MNKKGLTMDKMDIQMIKETILDTVVGTIKAVIVIPGTILIYFYISMIFYTPSEKCESIVDYDTYELCIDNLGEEYYPGDGTGH